MLRLSSVLLAAAVISAPVWTGTCLAEDFSAGKAVEGAVTSRSAGTAQLRQRSAGAPASSRSADAGSRAIADEATLIKAYGFVERSRDGKVTRMDAGPKLIEAIRGRQKSDSGSMTGGSMAMATQASRSVSGRDGRSRVKDTNTYPFDTVGLVQSTHDASGTTVNCTGALIGPNVVLTAAQCVYNPKLDGGWMDEVVFWPGINGDNDIPFGSYDISDAYVMDGFISQYDGTYDLVWQYDMALLILTDQAGNDLGWLGYGPFTDQTDFKTTLVGYQSDKPEWTQWKSSCAVGAKDMRELDFDHSCDADDTESIGGPVYVYTASEDSSRILGINMGGYVDNPTNWGLLIDETVAQWIDQANQ